MEWIVTFLLWQPQVHLRFIPSLEIGPCIIFTIFKNVQNIDHPGLTLTMFVTTIPTNGVTIHFLKIRFMCLPIKGVKKFNLQYLLGKNKGTKIRPQETGCALQKSISHGIIIADNTNLHLINICDLLDASSIQCQLKWANNYNLI